MARKLLTDISYVATVCVVLLLGIFFKLNMKQIISLVSLAIFIAGSFFYWKFRVAFAFFGITLLLVFDVIDIVHFVQFSNIDVITFIISMMIVIGFLEERKFFDWLTARIIVPFIDSPSIVFAILMILAFIMACLVDEVTSILFMLSIAIRVTNYYKVNPIPLFLFMVFTTNIGSSATVVGNPIGVLIAFRAGFSFIDFIRWSFPLAIVSVIVTTFIGILYMKSSIMVANQTKKERKKEEKEVLMEMSKFNDRLVSPAIVFTVVIFGLAMHHAIEQAFNLPTNSMLLGVAAFGAAISLFIEHEKAVEIVEKRVDWWTLVYFLLLFASVGTIQYTGLSTLISEGVADLAKGNIIYAMLVIGTIAGAITSVMDNVLAVSIVIPIINSLIGMYNTFPLWWISLIAGTYWGNATVIGSTSNIVMAGMLDRLKKEGKVERGIGMWEWIKIGVPISALTYTIAFLGLYLQLGIMPHL